MASKKRHVNNEKRKTIHDRTEGRELPNLEKSECTGKRKLNNTWEYWK